MKWKEVRAHIRKNYGEFRPGERKLLDALQSFRPSPAQKAPWTEIEKLSQILKDLRIPPFFYVRADGFIQATEPTSGDPREWSREPSCLSLIPIEFCTEVHDHAYPDTPMGPWMKDVSQYGKQP